MKQPINSNQKRMVKNLWIAKHRHSLNSLTLKNWRRSSIDARVYSFKGSIMTNSTLRRLRAGSYHQSLIPSFTHQHLKLPSTNKWTLASSNKTIKWRATMLIKRVMMGLYSKRLNIIHYSMGIRSFIGLGMTLHWPKKVLMTMKLSYHIRMRITW